MIYSLHAKTFQATNGNNPCPICEKTNGNCRSSTEDDQILCMTFPDKDSASNNPDYRFTKPTKDGLWGIYYPRTDDDNSFDRDRWLREKERQSEKEAERQRLVEFSITALSIESRDTAIRSILDQLNLSESDRRYLENRQGFPTEQLDYCVSVEKYQRLKNPVSPQLPGANQWGTGLTNSRKGILVAFPDADGYLVGMKFYDPNAKETGKSKSLWFSSSWLKNGFGPQLPNGENPIAVYWPQKLTDLTRIGLCEGVEWKAQEAANRLGFPVIGFSGASAIGAIEPNTGKLTINQRLTIEKIESQLWSIKKEYETITENLTQSWKTCETSLTGMLTTKAMQSSFCIAKQVLSYYMTLGKSLLNKILNTQYGKCITELTALEKQDFPFSIQTMGSNFSDLLKTGNCSTTFEICLIPDSGMLSNQAVINNYERALTKYEEIGRKISIAWWSQFTKADGDIDEIGPEKIAAIQYLTPEQFWQLCPERPEKVSKVNGFVKWLENELKPKNKGLPKVEGTEYQDGLIQSLLNEGKSILDLRPTGSGKSHLIPNLANPLGGRTWTITTDHRNPTVEAIANEFTDLHPRNEYGYYRDDDGKLQLAKADTPKDKILIDSKGKCIKASLFNDLSKLGYDPNQGGSENPICSSCPMLKTCRFVEGWYLNDRRETLSHSQIRAHLESMPRTDYDYSKDLIILDDFKFNSTKTLETNWGKLLVEQDRVRDYLSDSQYQELDRVLQSLKPLFDEKTRYGLEHETILKSLRELPSLQLLEDVLTAIAVNPLDLYSVFSRPDEINERNKTVESHFRAKAHKESQENLKNTPPNALIHLIKDLKGESGIILRITKGELTLTIDRRAEYAFLNEVGLLVVMDATTTPDDLKMMGIDRPLEVVKGSDKVTEHNNLTVMAIHTKGLGQNPYTDKDGNVKGISDRAIKRLMALDKALFEKYGYFPVIGPKPLKELFEHDGNWFNHNRGSNDFEGLPVLGFVGLPRPNLGAVKDEYLALMGTDDGFDEYYQNLTNKEILQGIGRPRANRYPDKQFTVLMIVPEQTDLNWLKDYGVKIINKSAFEISPEAGTEVQATAYRIVQATKELLTQGVKVTQDAIAKIVGMTQQNISKLLRAKGLTVEMLTQKLLNLLPNGYTTGPNKYLDRASCITQELYQAFSDFFDLPIEAIAQDAITTIETYGLDYFWEYLSNFPKALQAKYLTVLRFIITNDENLTPLNPSQ